MQIYLNPRTSSLPRPYAKGAVQAAYSFAHSHNSKGVMLPSRLLRQSNPIILNHQPHPPSLRLRSMITFLRVGVFADVVQGFLHQAVKSQLRFRRQRPQILRKFSGSPEFRGRVSRRRASWRMLPARPSFPAPAEKAVQQSCAALQWFYPAPGKHRQLSFLPSGFPPDSVHPGGGGRASNLAKSRRAVRAPDGGARLLLPGTDTGRVGTG